MAKDALQRQSTMQGQKLATSANVTGGSALQRAKLYDLKNRGVIHAAPNMKNVKPRVDCHWKKPEGSDRNAEATVVGTVMKTPTAKSKTTGTNQVSDVQRRLSWQPNLECFGKKAAPSTFGIGRTRQVSGCGLSNDMKTTTTIEAIVTKVNLIDSKVFVIEKSKPWESTIFRGKSSCSFTKLHADAALNIMAITTKPQNSVTGTNVVATKKGKPITRAAGRATKTMARLPKRKNAKKLPMPIIEEPEIHITFSWKLLEGIEDIDINDTNDLTSVAEYVNDIYNYLYSVEAKQSIRKDHLRGQKEIQASMRCELIDWIHGIHIKLFLTVETFHLAVVIIDLYLQAMKKTKQSKLKLVGITALLIAAKYEEFLAPIVNNYAYITDYVFTSRQICRMEVRILLMLDFNLSRPLSIHFLRRFSKAAAAEDIHHSLSKYLLELAVLKYDLASYKPSEIAAAAVFLTVHMMNGNAHAASGFNNNLWNNTLMYYSRYCAADLRPIAQKIAVVARYAPQSELKSIYTKYQTEKYGKISMRPELYGPLIDSIIENKE